ncbi:MAG: phosphotyrosine protein phosphatase [Planctomycetota bacterium]|nr:MAG: phosphotyrosine protein phosphatase [Planctomycetota bacterium]
MSKKVLFICSRNQWRSPTGEKVWRERFGFQARSAGTSPKAKKKVSAKDIEWAEIILVMEKKHKQRLLKDFSEPVKFKKIDVLNIPDDYGYMDTELVELFIVIGESYLD